LRRGGVIEVVPGPAPATGSIANLRTFHNETLDNKPGNMFLDGRHKLLSANRGWIKVTYAGAAQPLQPYAIKSKFVKIGAWPIYNPVTHVAVPERTIDLSVLGVPANRIVHAEAVIHADRNSGSGTNEHNITNLTRTSYAAEAQGGGNQGLFTIDQAVNKIRMFATAREDLGTYYATNHQSNTDNRGWFMVDYLAAQCGEGSATTYTRSFIGNFSPDGNDCHGFNGTGSAAIHVIQTKGPDIWTNNGVFDKFAFINKSRNLSSTIIKARVDKIENTNAWARAGIMIRASLNDNSRHVAMVVTPKPVAGSGNGIGFTSRTTDGGATSETSPNSFSAPYWLSILKDGTNFRGYMSTTGTGDPVTNPGSWTQVGSTVTISNFPANYFVGLCQTAGNNSPSIYNTSVYSNLNF
jgi:hypothetical protein